MLARMFSRLAFLLVSGALALSAAAQPFPGADSHDLVAIDHRAGLVADDHTVGITVECDAQMGLTALHLAAHAFRVQ